MRLTEDEATEAYKVLSRALVEHHLEWVVDQVEEKVALGKLTHRAIKRQRQREDVTEFQLYRPVEAREGAKRESFTVAEDFTAVEKLAILVQSIEQAVICVQDTAEDTFRSLDDLATADGGRNVQLLFEPDAPIRAPFTLNRGELSDRRSDRALLTALLHELIDESPNADPTRLTR